MNLRQESQRVTIAEAARILSLSQTKIREWLKEPGFDAIRNDQGWWLIDRTSLLAKAASESFPKESRRVGGATSRTSTSHSSEVSLPSTREVVLEDRIRDLQDALSRERRINDELREQNRELQQIQTQHLAELRALLESTTKDKGLLSRWIRT